MGAVTSQFLLRTASVLPSSSTSSSRDAQSGSWRLSRYTTGPRRFFPLGTYESTFTYTGGTAYPVVCYAAPCVYPPSLIAYRAVLAAHGYDFASAWGSGRPLAKYVALSCAPPLSLPPPVLGFPSSGHSPPRTAAPKRRRNYTRKYQKAGGQRATPRVTDRRGDYGGAALPAPELLTRMSPASPQVRVVLGVHLAQPAAATADGSSTRTYAHDPRDEIIYPLECTPHARKQGNRQLQAVDYRLLNVVPHLDELLLSVPTDFAAMLEQATTTAPATADHEANLGQAMLKVTMEHIRGLAVAHCERLSG
ncbi:hypothetical protein EKO27_g6155 [Xylaria grammica]|uniref:Uncharacterized protein n=1 Tax=Xylaria grammica TaxID=363999 RepID=A0A439D3I1_9PEZI|nr:hypothetical protein EKO27_g6155 [Xylaria grammica]